MPRLHLTGWHGIGVHRGGGGNYQNIFVTGAGEKNVLSSNLTSTDPIVPEGHENRFGGHQSGYLLTHGDRNHENGLWKLVPDIPSNKR